MRCPNCSGTLYFNIKDQVLKCKHCSKTFDVKEYEADANAEELIFDDAKVYTCKSCGAELISGNDEAVTYCSYCGSEAIIEGNLKGVKKPKYIIPFKISKEKCKDIYNAEVKDQIYVPKEFKDPDFIERFRPFYIPYWMYQIRFREEPFEVKGYRYYTKGGYDYSEEYNIEASVKEKGLYGIPYDASRNFDDSIAENIAPFKKNEMRTYKPAYLAGMYADSPNVDAKLYVDEVLDKATEAAAEDIRDSVSPISIDLPRKKKLEKLLDARYDGEDAIFLPVWFLTWRKGNRVAYAVVNGQTGRIHIDMPADISQFMLYTLLGALAIFVLFSMFVTVTSRFVLWFSALLVYLLGRTYRKELKEIRDRENHVFDKGYLLNDEKELPMSEKKRNRIRRRSGKNLFVKGGSILIASAIFMFSVLFALSGAAYDILVSQAAAIALTFLVLILETISFIRTFMVTIYLKNKRSLLVILLALLGVGYSFGVAASEPVQDWWYYLGALICLVCASIMCIDLIARYNETSTRPLPSFYERKGGNDGAKDM